MIIAITDAKGLTDIVEREQSLGKDIAAIYGGLFTSHMVRLTARNIAWKIIKTTGDGLLITTAYTNSNPDFLMTWIRTMFDLYEQCTPEIRIVAHYCPEKELIRVKLKKGNKNGCIQDLNVFTRHLKHDIFGPQVNLVFRLAQAASARTFLVTDEFVGMLVKNDVLRNQFDAKQQFTIEKFTFGPPVPITHLKGIERVGFSSKEHKHKPIWLWEINKIL